MAWQTEAQAAFPTGIKGKRYAHLPSRPFVLRKQGIFLDVPQLRRHRRARVIAAFEAEPTFDPVARPDTDDDMRKGDRCERASGPRVAEKRERLTSQRLHAPARSG